MSPLGITLIILSLTIIAFITGKVPYSIISIGIILSLILTGVLKPQEALSGFTNHSVILFAAMFIIGAGLTKTSILDKIKSLVIGYKDDFRILILIATVVASLIAILTSATATAAILMPLIITLANEIGTSRSKILYPAICVANFSVGATILGQGAANMAFNEMMMKAGASTPFTIWSFTKAKLPMVIIGIIYMAIIGWRLLPSNPNESFSDDLKDKESEKLPPIKEKIAIVIILLTVGALFFARQLGIDLYVLACIGAAALIIFGILSEKEALSSIHLPTVFLFAGLLPLSHAIKVTGAGEIVADKMVMMVGNTTNPYIIMAVFFIVPLIMTQLMSNLATIMIFVPLVSSAGVSLGIDPRALVMGVLVAGGMSILTPMAAPPQALIFGPGGYTIKDYFKAGGPLIIILTIFTIFYLPFLFPF